MGAVCSCLRPQARKDPGGAHWRAITLRQLKEVVNVIEQRCQVEEWVSTRDWKTPLTPKTVNLYDLNYYVILPSTLPDPVRVAGLPLGCYQEGEDVWQKGKGKGKVRHTVEGGTEVQVDVTEGRLVSGHEVIIGKQSCNNPSISLDRHLSYVGTLTGDAQKPAWFITHWWGEPVLEFVECVRRHADVRGLSEDTPYWACAYANDQHYLVEDVCSDPTGTSFFRALTSEGCEGVLLVLNGIQDQTQAAMAFSRIWCVYEMFLVVSRLQSKLDVASCCNGMAQVITEGLTKSEEDDDEILPGAGWENKMYREQRFPIDVLTEGVKVKVENAKATEPDDQRHILNAIAGRDLDAPRDCENLEDQGAYEKVNRVLRGLMAVIAWPQALRQRMVDKMGLPAALKEDDQRKDLQLCFSSAGEEASESGSASQGVLDDEALCLLAEHLPANLSGHVAFDFSYCTRIGCTGVGALGQALSKYRSLMALLLNFSSGNIDKNCMQKLGLSISALAGLKSLTFKCGYCPHINDDAAEELLASIGSLSSLEVLVFNAEFCDGFGDGSLQVLGRSVQMLCKSLTRLTIDCTQCRQITDKGIKSLSSGLGGLALLVFLNLTFHNCLQITQEGAEALGSGLRHLHQLGALHLNFDLCWGISHAGITGIVRGVRGLANIEEITLTWWPEGCHREKITSVGDLQKDPAEFKASDSASCGQPWSADGVDKSGQGSCRLRGRNVLFLTDFKFWDEEYHHTRRALESHGAQVRVASQYGSGTELIGQQNGMRCKVDYRFDELLEEEEYQMFDAVFVPGGAAPQAFRHDEAAQKIIDWTVQNGRVAAAICHGVKSLGAAGVLKDTTCTSYAGIKLAVEQYGANWSDQEVVVDTKSGGGVIITSRTVPDLPALSSAMVAEIERRVPAKKHTFVVC